MSSML